MNKISVVISAYNEEKLLEDCLKSVTWADQVIVVDNNSTDDTAKIAKKYADEVYSRPNNLMLNVNKNYGFSKATGDWILSLDADERATDELKKEILKELQVTSYELRGDVSGYWIPRKNIIFGKWIQHTGWYPDYQLRLFRRDRGKFAQKHVHEMVEVKGKTEQLKGHIQHYNYETVDQFFQKLLVVYSHSETDNLLKDGYVFNWKDAIIMPLREFFNRYFAHKGYRDGLHGLILSLLMSVYHLVVFLRLWERKKYMEQDVNLGEVASEVGVYRQTWKYWVKHAKVDLANNGVAKLVAKYFG